MSLMLSSKSNQQMQKPYCLQDSFETGGADGAMHIGIRKGMNAQIDSYSAFFENDQTTPTGLDGWLRTRGVARLTLVGLATDFCVQFSALDAARLGFDVTVERALCRAIDLDGSLAAAEAAMIKAGVDLN